MSLWHERVVAPVLAQLRQGITPEKIALTVALGIGLGVFPILGASTLLCVVAGVALRLNHPVLQVVNYLTYPAQVLLLIPFYRAGEHLFGATPVPMADVNALVARFRAAPWQFLLDYGRVGAYGVVVWCLLAPLLVAATYFTLKPLLFLSARRGDRPNGASDGRELP